MEKLISELRRLYLQDGQQYHEDTGQGWAPAAPLTDAILAQHLRGERTVALGGGTSGRALVMPFRWHADGDGERQWAALCGVANALQHDLALPAPAVAIDGDSGFALWLSLAQPVAAAEAREFLGLLRTAYVTVDDTPAPAVRARLAEPAGPAGPGGTALDQLPPGLHRASLKWAAFIHPGMGHAFAEEGGLEMPPTAAAQVAFLEKLDSISAGQFTAALDALRLRHGDAAPVVAEVAEVAEKPARAGSPRSQDGRGGPAAPASLLLQDATLEDIVRQLQARGIEPTFRFITG